MLGIYFRGRNIDAQSALRLANLTTLPHFAVSSAISLPKSAGVPESGGPLRSASRALIWDRIVAYSLRCTTKSGVRLRDNFVGAQTRAVIENLTCDDYFVRTGLGDECLQSVLDRLRRPNHRTAQRVRQDGLA